MFSVRPPASDLLTLDYLPSGLVYLRTDDFEEKQRFHLIYSAWFAPGWADTQALHPSILQFNMFSS